MTLYKRNMEALEACTLRSAYDCYDFLYQHSYPIYRKREGKDYDSVARSIIREQFILENEGNVTYEIIARGLANHGVEIIVYDSGDDKDDVVVHFKNEISDFDFLSALEEINKLLNPNAKSHKYEFRIMSKNGMECIRKRVFMTRAPFARGGTIHYHYPLENDYEYDLTIIKNHFKNGYTFVDSGCRHFRSLDEAIAHWKPSVEYCDDVGINPSRQSIYRRAVKFLSILENFKAATAKPLSEAKVLSLGAES